MRKLHSYRLCTCLAAMLFIIIRTASWGQVNQVNWKYSNPKPMGFTITYTSFIDNNNGLAIGSNGCIGKTTDAGRTWQYGAFSYTDATGIVQRPAFADVQFVTPTVAYAAGAAGALIKSTDGGVNWNLV